MGRLHLLFDFPAINFRFGGEACMGGIEPRRKDWARLDAQSGPERDWVKTLRLAIWRRPNLAA
jgi:hypothetical protein